MNNLVRRQRGLGLAVLIPIFLLFAAIRIGPILANFAVSLTNYRLLRPSYRFTGLDTFKRLLADPSFHEALKNSVIFVLTAVPALLLLGLSLALLIHASRRMEPLFQTLYFLPFILPTVATTVVWKWIYAPGDLGILNQFMGFFGLSPVSWLIYPQQAIFAIIVMHVWKNVGLYVVVLIVGLKAIPIEYREAANLDGANRWQLLRHIELPLLRPALLFSLVYSTIMAWSVFTEVYVMTEGSDVSSSVAQFDVLTTLLYREGFVYRNSAYASAISVVLFLAVMTIVYLQMRLVEERSG